ncbi:Gfo/Idh/MocA family protein [Occultella gossypii]|uniref:Gfo/Idh/MocA family oxidoreductase n=1 Tax=Occultella gossypii TaxID=2800820 RepID=A0ABS7S8U8_9MICO|nr:Gfo/Idh/MocA family oxidoreductase [Occultella gossypii]MBZ2196776.1 Gfo/Idh/MocA family oxidoreductase [Occultella gossypii]
MSDTAAPRRRFAVIGTGHRSEMYVKALAGAFCDIGQIVAFVDPNEVRMHYYDGVARESGQSEPILHYGPDDFERMVAETSPDGLVVSSVDATHARYIVAGLERGLDVVSEKPMTIDGPSMVAIRRAAEQSSGTLRVGFNYRYSPRNALVRELIASGRIGEVTSVHFEWCLDTLHGADYFRRWHRNKARSGGLEVHKSSHHFDLVNWWLADIPERVFASGGLKFYGAQNARRRGLGERPALGRDLPADDPFRFDLADQERLRGLYLDAEGIDGYHRDQDVFGEGIDIEDNLSVVVAYRGGASLAYTLCAHSPWEGYRVGINGTEGRIEIDVVERGSNLPSGGTGLLGPYFVLDPSAEAAGDPDDRYRPHRSRVLLQRHWEPALEIPIPGAEGAHGGGDDMMLRAIFRGEDDPLGRAAGYEDGIRSSVIGAAVNLSLRDGKVVLVQDLLA